MAVTSSHPLPARLRLQRQVAAECWTTSNLCNFNMLHIYDPNISSTRLSILNVYG